MHICLDYIPELLAQPDINKQVGIAMRLEHTYLHLLHCDLVMFETSRGTQHGWSLVTHWSIH